MSTYLLSLSPNAAKKLGTIHDPDTKLKITVIDLLKSPFKSSKGEVSFFVTEGSMQLAFETEGYSKHRKVLILQMIAWYCLYLGLQEAKIHATQPLLKAG